MGQLGLMAIGAFHHVGNGKFPVGSPLSAACLGVSSFGQWHLVFLFGPGQARCPGLLAWLNSDGPDHRIPGSMVHLFVFSSLD